MATFRLHGVECHECGRPASWHSDGVTMPCGCGTPKSVTRDDVITKITNFARAEQAARQQLCAEVAPEDRPDNRELNAWVEIAEVLKQLAGRGK